MKTQTRNVDSGRQFTAADAASLHSLPSAAVTTAHTDLFINFDGVLSVVDSGACFVLSVAPVAAGVSRLTSRRLAAMAAALSDSRASQGGAPVS